MRRRRPLRGCHRHPIWTAAQAPGSDAMTPEERQMITGLFDRMRSYGTPEKDREAETLINEAVRSTPDAAYMLVQSVLVQEHALQEAGNRIKDLEEQVRSAAAARGSAANRPDRAVSLAACSAAAGRSRSRAPAASPSSARAPRRRPPMTRINSGHGRKVRRSSRRPRRPAAVSFARPWRRLRASPAACWPRAPSVTSWAVMRTRIRPTLQPPPSQHRAGAAGSGAGCPSGRL